MMFIATMLTNPARKELDRVTVESLRDAWAGGEARWLDPGAAAEFSIDRVPENLWQVWDAMQTLGIDIAVQRAEGRRKKLLLADMDSTMIEQECIDELAAEAGVGEHVAAVTRRAMNGEVQFEEALRERVALLAGLPASVVDKVLAERITPMPGGHALVATMKAHGAAAALVSGGFTAFTGPVARMLGFDENRANTLLTKDGLLTGQVLEPILGRAAKVQALEEIVVRHGIGAGDVLAVGDGANDLGMLRLAGAGVALHAKPSVAAQCSLRVNHGDLTALLFLQGFSRDEFVD
jgi:phosphoserine phosphatase